MRDLPLLLVAVTVSAYWLGVGRMIVRVRRRRRDPASRPASPARRLLWLVWLPLVAAWIALPYFGLARSDDALAVPAFARREGYAPVRWLAAALGVACLAATIGCWRRMGRQWRMDVSVATRTELITDGPFRRVRHPIYAWSILLMLCTLLALPNVPMLVAATVHVALMILKARSEERQLAQWHGEAWRRYVERTGRFFPRFGAR